MVKRKSSNEFVYKSASSIDRSISRPQEAQADDTLKLESQYSINILNNYLFESVKNWDLAAVRYYLNKGANINITYTDSANNTAGNSLIMLAVATYKIVSKENKDICKIDLIELLIDHGYDIYAKNSEGATVIDLVDRLPISSNLYKRISKERSYVESKEKYDLLADGKKEEINKGLIDILTKRQDTSEDYTENKKDLVNLIARGVDVNITDTDGNTPLMLSAQNHHKGPNNYLQSMVRIVIKCGADLQAKNVFGMTVLDVASHFQFTLKSLGAKASEGTSIECAINGDQIQDAGQNQGEDDLTQVFAEIEIDNDLMNDLVEIAETSNCLSNNKQTNTQIVSYEAYVYEWAAIESNSEDFLDDLIDMLYENYDEQDDCEQLLPELS
ncbi:MAG: hypothetical protein P8P83_05330 [Rickettsiaceae bacterium]|nr:hypothetical protein [Rickettsiaceae bacterium]